LYRFCADRASDSRKAGAARAAHFASEPPQFVAKGEVMAVEPFAAVSYGVDAKISF